MEKEVEDLDMRKRNSDLECNLHEGKTIFIFYLLLYIQFLVERLAKNRCSINILVNG